MSERKGDDPAAAARELVALRARAEGGCPDAQTQLASRYFYGEGVPRSAPVSAEWLRKAANAGYAFAQSKLGERYLFGLGVEANKAAARIWFRLAADQGHSTACIQLGKLCELGHGGAPKDPQLAEMLFLRAASAGSTRAMLELGILYQNHYEGRPRDLAAAFAWLLRARRTNDPGIRRTATRMIMRRKFWRTAHDLGLMSADLDPGMSWQCQT